MILLSYLRLRLILSVLLCFAFIIASIPFAFAESFSAYSSVGQNDSIVQSLIGIYLNDSLYDPFNQYIVVRVGQYDYRLFFGKDLTEEYGFFQYHAVPVGTSMNYQYDTGYGTHLILNMGHYKGVGNVQQSILSPIAEQYKYQFIMISISFLIIVAVLFKIFRNRVRVDKGASWHL